MCVCVYVHTYIHTCGVHIYIYIYIYICIYTYISVSIYIYICFNTCISFVEVLSGLTCSVHVFFGVGQPTHKKPMTLKLYRPSSLT